MAASDEQEEPDLQPYVRGKETETVPPGGSKLSPGGKRVPLFVEISQHPPRPATTFALVGVAPAVLVAVQVKRFGLEVEVVGVEILQTTVLHTEAVQAFQPRKIWEKLQVRAADNHNIGQS